MGSSLTAYAAVGHLGAASIVGSSITANGTDKNAKHAGET
jgi:hypothetical protein